MSSLSCKGAIFDLDGVITQTAVLHFKAWKQIFDEFLHYLSTQEGKKFKPFTLKKDYLPYVDGIPRYQGIKSFLDSRNIKLPLGDISDPPGKKTICGLGNKKNEVFRSIISQNGIYIYQSTIYFIKELKASGIKIGVASSSMNCELMLEKAGILDLFETVIGGITSKRIGLKGKPYPDIFLNAAHNLGIHPNECMMVEDSVSGVRAGKNGNFALIVGVARNGNKHALLEHGADIIVEDMKELTFPYIETWFKEGIQKDGWNLTYHGFEPKVERLRETLTTVGNGYFGTRGCFEGEKAYQDNHYPGTYIAGVYNKLTSWVHDKKIYNNDFVNCPNWLLIEIKIGDSDFIRLRDVEILHYTQNLNLKDGVLSRSVTFKDRKGRVTSIESDRFAGMDNPHYGAIKYEITPHNYSEKIVVKSSLDGNVINDGVARYRKLNSKHLSFVCIDNQNGTICLQTKTNNSKISIFMASRADIYQNDRPLNLEVKRSVSKDPGMISQIFSIDAQEGASYVLEKFVSIYTSKDMDAPNPEEALKSTLLEIECFDHVLEKHKKAWHSLWDKADIIIEGDRFSQKAVRLHIYHLLVTASLHNKNIDAGMPARGLHGEAYRGHIFWDELFIFPFYNLHFPEISKALLMYRYKRLDEAREYAKENGYQGAMYPWQTADDGKEETQIIHYNPVSGKWDPDLSRRQRHVSIAIAYNIWEYYYCTNDLEFLHTYGAEIMLEIARFWASATKYDKKDRRYHITGVMGPDEFHEKYPEAKEPGLKDNAYTNILVSWLLHKTIETVEHLPEKVIKNLSGKIGFTMDEIDTWKKIVTKMNLIITKDEILSQFDGYMDLEELNWGHYRKKYKDIRRMDRILKSEGDSPDRHKVSKQADVLMTYYLLSPGQVKNILGIMGYTVNDDLTFMKKNYEYYTKRTSHGSTLSYIVHSAVLKYLTTHKKDMWKWFFEALKSDIYDTQGGTTSEGIHCGVMAGTIDIIIKSFAGINIFKDNIQLARHLPSHWHKLSFKVLYKNKWLNFEITKYTTKVNRILDIEKKIGFQINIKEYSLSND